MARKRREAAQAGRKADRTRQRKVTMWLDAELAKTLHHAAIEDGKDIGQVAEAGIRQALAGRFWTDRRRPEPPPARPAIAAGTEPAELPPAGEEAA